MAKHLTLLFILLISLNHLNAQQLPGHATGMITEANGQPIPLVSISLVKANDSTKIVSTITNEKGVFLMEGVKTGSYILRVSSMGYQTFTSAAFELTATSRNKDFGRLILKPVNKQLGEVIIRADKPEVQQQEGGLTVNIQNRVMTKGSTALQVLERSPGVVLDPHNNTISLNGKNGVMVMIDGKLMRISMTQVVALLNGMSADNIDKIELLTTPPAKYDADGNAGLINIVTKKNKRKGTFGSFTATAGYGRAEKGSVGLNLNHDTENANIYGSYSFSHNKTYGHLSAIGAENVGAVGGQTSVNYLGIAQPVADYHNAIFGIDNKLNSKVTIGGSINYVHSADYNHNHNNGLYTLPPDSILRFNSMINGLGHGQNITGSIYLENDISKTEKINFDADYIYYKSNSLTGVESSFVNSQGAQVTTDSLYAPQQRDIANSLIKVGVVKTDYSKQINSKIKLEAGAKGTYTRSSAASGIQNLVNSEWVSSLTTSSSSLVTKEGIGAVYASLTAQLDSPTNLVVGARYEYSSNRADNALGNANTFDRKLGKLFPSVFLTRKLNNNDELQLSYTERISRPSYNDLASYITYNDPVSVITGNPALKPTITNNLKLGYNNRGYLFSLLFSRDDNTIIQGQVSTGPSKQLVYIMPQNVTYQNNITFQASIPLKVTDWWSMNYGFVGGWKQFRLDFLLTPVIKAYWSYSANFSQSFKLPDNFSVELSGYYNSSTYYGDSNANCMGMLNAGIKKELKNNKGSFQLSIADVLRSANYNSYIGKHTTDAFSSQVRINYQAESRTFPIIKLTYFRSFGTDGLKTQRKADSASKEERDRI